MRHKKNCECDLGGSFPVFGEGFTRRHFMRVAGTSVVASFFADVASARLLSDATSVNPALRNSAKNCILIFLPGAPSQIDTFDLKEGAWTPLDFAPTTFGSIRFPQGLMPKTAEQRPILPATAAEFGWSGDRDIRPEDLTATIYSALGIDYTTVRRDDPLGRGFEYVPFAKDGIYLPVNELF